MNITVDIPPHFHFYFPRHFNRKEGKAGIVSSKYSGISGIHASLALLVMISTALFSCSGQGEREEKKELVIFHAGSLSVPFRRISDQFMKENPGVEIKMEAAGSRACARKITDLGRECDIMASADYTVIDALMIPDHASWNIRFASNEMALVYHEKSRRSDSIDSDSWIDILLDENVAFGRSDPNSDPCGYRAVLTMKLAEIHYGREGLAEKMLSKDTRYIRPKETDLLALLESGAIDYIFLYRSVASQHGLDYLILPDEVNLKNAGFSDFYRQAEVEISGKKPGTKITKRGAPMVYGVTIPSNSPRPDLALEFIEYLLDPEKGMAVMVECGQPSVVPSFTDSWDALPASLRKFATREAEKQ